MTNRPTLTNQDVTAALEKMASLLQIIEANRFQIIAFQNAAEAIHSLAPDINTVAADGKLTAIPGIGKSIAASIQEFLDTGQIADMEKLLEEVPVGVLEMLQVPDVGPKTARRLWQELNITSVAELKAAAEGQKIRGLKGFGAKSEEKILKGIDLMNRRGDGRTPIGKARPTALAILAELEQALPAGALEKIEIAGSLRRWKETIGDLDILVVSQQPAAVMQAFRELSRVAEVVGSGPTKTSVVLHDGLQVDLRVVERQHWGAALQYFTGSQAHNVAVRELAVKQGWSLNEYGLTATGAGDAAEGEQRFFDEEPDLYAFLGLDYPAPPLRENRGEVQAARAHTLPQLITLNDMRGELHGHSTWSDGKATIAEMAQTAMQRGYQYWAVCDHSIGLGVTGGVDADRLVEQAQEIAALNRQFAEQGIDFKLLRGIEVEVLADGTLGLPDEVLAELDVVVASIHSGLRQDRATITERCLKVVRNPHVDILGHATGRLLGYRAPSELDVEQVLQVCAENGAVVEINAHPERLDINDVYARRAIELGCKIAINSDAHAPTDMELMEYGLATAQRAWLRASDVINAYPLPEMLALLKRNRK
ncbi:MAG: DNA polymerase/3'-5' exonuclease PolX [Caldilineaceae bacterium]